MSPGRKTHAVIAMERNHMQLLNVPLEGAFYPKKWTTDPDPHALMLVETVDIFPFTDGGRNTAPFMHLSNADLFGIGTTHWLTAWMFKVGSGQAWYLKVVHRRHWTLGGAPPVPLVQSVPGLRAQNPGCLLLLEVLDESHGSIGAGQIVAPWGLERRERCLMDGWDKKKQKRTDSETHQGWLSRNESNWHCIDSCKKLSRSVKHFLLCNREDSEQEIVLSRDTHHIWTILQRAHMPDRLTLIGKYFILGGLSLFFPLNLFQPIQIKPGISY